MCQFFSFCGDGYGNYLYANWTDRVRLNHQEVDSHTAILTRAGVSPEKQEKWSFYEYNPLTKEFAIDNAVAGHDTEAARNWVEALDWKTIVEPLVVKPIINPFTKRAPKITADNIKALARWASVRYSVWSSVWSSVRSSVGDSVGDSVWSSVGVSVGVSVGASVGVSVGDSVWNSVWSSVWAYASSFLAISYEYDFSSAVQLWEAGLVPSFDGKTWRLHGGKKTRVLSMRWRYDRPRTRRDRLVAQELGC